MLPLTTAQKLWCLFPGVSDVSRTGKFPYGILAYMKYEPEPKRTSTGDDNLGIIGSDSFHFGSIPHYHGDIVRQLLLSAGALIIVAVPMLSTISIFTTPFELAGAVLLVVCAGMTSASRAWPLVLDAMVSAVGLVVYEPLALLAYRSGDLLLFVVYEALSLLFLFALYFSIKTIRSMFSKKESFRVEKNARRVRADGEEYAEPPVALSEIVSEPQRQDSRPGDMREFGRYDD